MKDLFLDRIDELYEAFLNLVPNLLLGIVFFGLGVLIVKLIKKQIFSRVVSRAKDSVAAQFITDILVVVIYIIIIFSTFKILGFSTLTQTIIGAAGLTTFIIGFALKDIGENFLAGIIMIFDRPFEMGDLIQIDQQIGRVKKISIRETTIKTTDGKDVYIPNSDIIKKHFINYTIDDQLKESFDITVFPSNNIEEVTDIILEKVNSFNHVLKTRKAHVATKSIDNGLVQLSIFYWYNLRGTRSRDGQLKTDIMLAVLRGLQEKNIGMPRHAQDIAKQN